MEADFLVCLHTIPKVIFNELLQQSIGSVAEIRHGSLRGLH